MSVLAGSPALSVAAAHEVVGTTRGNGVAFAETSRSPCSVSPHAAFVVASRAEARTTFPAPASTAADTAPAVGASFPVLLR